MTTLNALKSLVKYPLGEDLLTVLLFARGLYPECEFTKEVATSDEFLGVRADCYKELLDTPDISEGSLSISLNDRTLLTKLANDIYSKIGEPLIGCSEKEDKQPKITAYYD